MDIDLVYRYVRDSCQAYQVCATELGVSAGPGDLTALIRATRAGHVPRRGEVSTAGSAYEYHVHGTGYSFKESVSGKVIHFDAVSLHGIDRLCFSAWGFYQYALSVGEIVSEAEAVSELNRLSNLETHLVHVQDGPFSYYHCLTEW